MISLVLILLLAIIWIYGHFNGRIKTLEEKIAQLDRDNNSVTTIKEEPITNTYEKPISTTNLSYPENPTVDSKPYFPEIPQQKKESAFINFVKQNALSIIGIFTLVIGIGYFVKYAIDRNWISEITRVVIGIVTGISVIGLGHWLRKNYSIFSSILIGGGISILYLSITLCFREYAIFPQTTAFAILTAITAIAIGLAYKYNSEVLMIIGQLGGFFAPMMISTGESNYTFLLTYISILNIGMLVISYLRPWKSIGWVSFIMTFVYLIVWSIDKTEMTTVWFIAASYIIFYALALINFFRSDTLAKNEILLLFLINIFSVTQISIIFWDLAYQGHSIFPLIFAGLNGLLLLKSKKSVALPIFIALIISLVTVAIALELDVKNITIIWSIELVLLVYLWQKTKYNIFRQCYLVLLTITCISLLVSWENYTSAHQLNMVFNPIFAVTAICIASLAICRYYLFKDKTSENTLVGFSNLSLITTLILVATTYIGVLLEINFHIWDKPEVYIITVNILYTIYFIFLLICLRTQIKINTLANNLLIYLLLFAYILMAILPQINRSILEGEIDNSFYFFYLLHWIPILVFVFKIIKKTDFLNQNFGYYALIAILTLLISFEIYHIYLFSKLQSIKAYSQLTKHFNVLYLPILWTILSAGLIYYGIKNNLKQLNTAGFALIAITIAKLYLYDVWQMDNVSRIIAFIILGILLLLSSFLFQRLKNIVAKLVDVKKMDSKETD